MVRGMTPPAGHPTKWVPTRIASVATDQFYSQGAKTTQFTARNCKVTLVAPNGAKVVSDLDFRWGQIPVWDNDSRVMLAEKTGAAIVADARGGCGPNGEIRVWKPEVE